MRLERRYYARTNFTIKTMARQYLSAKTLDDLMRAVIEEILTHGQWIKATKGDAIEVTGVLLELTNPRARLSRTGTRGKPYSCLGELCWYLAKSNSLHFIEYYARDYKKSADGNVIYGGYGPRLFSWKGLNQVENIIRMLASKPSTRKAVIQLFDAKDLAEEHNDIPCTCTLQFMIRDNKLSLFTNMRSNDIYIGMPHDFFCFTMLQEIIARSLDVDLGTYKHAVGSLHLYKKDMKAAESFIEEGWQPTKAIMPPMPKGDPWNNISVLLKCEEHIRKADDFDETKLSGVDPYWADLIRMLLILRYKRQRKPGKIKSLQSQMSSDAYSIFIGRVLQKLS